MNTAVFMRILTKSRHKYAAKNRLGFDSFYLVYRKTQSAFQPLCLRWKNIDAIK